MDSLIVYNEELGKEVEESSNVGLGRSQDYRDSGGIAYICLPSDIDRASYIKDCYLNNWVSIHIEGESIINRVSISPDILNFIEFPARLGELGTPLIWILDQIKKQIIICGRVTNYDKVGHLEEDTFSFIRNYNDSFVEIRGNPAKNYLSLLLLGNGKDVAINIKAKNSSDSGKCIINIESDLEINIKSGHIINIESQEINSTTSDDDGVSRILQNSQGVVLQGNKVKVGSGDQAAMLGNIWTEFMEDFIDELAAITISSPQGQMPILNKDKVLKLKDRLQDIISEILFIE